MSDVSDPRAAEELDGLLRRTLEPSGAPPGLRERVLAALDHEDARRAAAVRRRRLYRPVVGLALAASLLVAFLLPGALGPRGLGFLLPGVAAGPRHVHYEGTVVCIDCAARGAPLEVQVGCRVAGHDNGLRLHDGALVRFTRKAAAAPQPLVDPSLRGRRVVLDGELYEAIGYLDVSSYSLI